VMGATDGAYLRSAGIPCYGIQGFFMDRDDIRFHGRDERMSVQSFYEGQAFLYELVKRLSSGPPSHHGVTGPDARCVGYIVSWM
jgi:acetylornithine deacetylase/succinyl-diaminopimelate desuccinylase-like protein